MTTTNVMRILTKAGIPFTHAEYEVDESDLSGTDAAAVELPDVLSAVQAGGGGGLHLHQQAPGGGLRAGRADRRRPGGARHGVGRAHRRRGRDGGARARRRPRRGARARGRRLDRGRPVVGRRAVRAGRRRGPQRARRAPCAARPRRRPRGAGARDARLRRRVRHGRGGRRLVRRRAGTRRRRRGARPGTGPPGTRRWPAWTTSPTSSTRRAGS